MDLLRRVGAGELAELFGAARAAGRQGAPPAPLSRARRTGAAGDAGRRPPLPRPLRRRHQRRPQRARRAAVRIRADRHPAARRGRAADSLLVVWAMFFDLQGMQEPRELARGWIAEHTDAAQRAFLLPESTEWDAPLDQADGGAVGRADSAGARRAGGASAAARAPLRSASADFIDAVGSNNWAVAGSRSKDGARHRLQRHAPRAAAADHLVPAGAAVPRCQRQAAPHGRHHLAGRAAGGHGRQQRPRGVGLHQQLRRLHRPGRARDRSGQPGAGAHAGRLGDAGQPSKRPSWSRARRRKNSSCAKVRSARCAKRAGAPMRSTGSRTCRARSTSDHRKLETADTLDEALAVAATIGIPAQNFVAGDDKGNIGWTITGMLPHRAQAAGAASFPIAAGGAALTWDGALAPADYPKLVNPAGGQLSTANSRQLMGAGADADRRRRLRPRRAQPPGARRPARAGAEDRRQGGVRHHDGRPGDLHGRLAHPRDQGARCGGASRASRSAPNSCACCKTGWSGHASVESTGYRLARGFMWALHDLLFDAANGEMARDRRQGQHAGGQHALAGGAGAPARRAAGGLAAGRVSELAGARTGRRSTR